DTRCPALLACPPPHRAPPSFPTRRSSDLQMHPNGTSPKFKPLADSARNACRKADGQGANTWMHIMREEVWEALSETDRDRLRAELVQVIAVGVAWIECLDEQTATT